MAAAGADILRGFGGNDTYIVDNAGDLVVEAAGGGDDTVRASVSYALAAGASVEMLRTTNDGASTSISLTGSDIPNELRGDEGNNTLDGKAGADVLRGFGGNDLYIVDNAGDLVVEATGGGDDTVRASVSYALTADASVEMLRTTNDGASTSISLTGSDIPNELRGNEGSNIA